MAGPVRIFQLAKKLGLRSEALMQVLGELGVSDVSAASTIDLDTAKAAAELISEQATDARKQREAREEAEKEEAAEAAKAQEAAAAAQVEAQRPAAAEAAAQPAAETAEAEEEEAFLNAPPWAAPESLRSLEEQLAELEVEEKEEEEAVATLP